MSSLLGPEVSHQGHVVPLSPEDVPRSRCSFNAGTSPVGDRP